MNAIKSIRYICFILHLMCMLYGVITSNPDVCLIGVGLLFTQNCLWAVENIKYRTVYLLFHLVFFVFILGRPIYQLKEGTRWFFYGNDELTFTLTSIWITLMGLFIGGLLITFIYKRNKKNEYNKLLELKVQNDNQYILYSVMRKFVLVAFIITFLLYMMTGIERVSFASNNSYAEYFISFSSKIPYLLRGLAGLMPYALCIYLALKPNKGMTLLVLGLYILSAVPNLIVGTRNPIILNIMFAICYLWIRNSISKEEKWIGKKELIVILAGLPVLAIIMYMYAYIRADLSIPQIGIQAIWGFIYQQGTTFDVLSLGFMSLPFLPANHHYTFGGIIDYYAHGSVAQKYFGAIDLGGNNSALMGLESNNFAHNMSYVMHPEYLNGHGWGTSYILETYADYGYIGLAIYSIVLSIFLVSIVKLCKKNYYFFTMVLIVLTNLFFLPRDSALGCVNSLMEIPFILVMILCILFEKILMVILRKRNFKI